MIRFTKISKSFQTNSTVHNLIKRFTLSFPFSSSYVPEDPKFKKDEILKVRNEAKKLLEEEKREKEEREKYGIFSPEEIMKLLINIETLEDFEVKVRNAEKPVLLFCYAQ